MKMLNIMFSRQGDLEETDIVHIHSRSLESKSNSKKEDDDISPDNISMEYSDDDVELEHAASDTEASYTYFIITYLSHFK